MADLGTRASIRLHPRLENEDQAGTRSWRVLYIMLKCLYFTQKWLEDIEKVDALKSCDSNYTIELVDFFSAP